MLHELKSWPGYFEEVVSGKKRFEVRKNDRDFQIADWVLLREWEPQPKTYSSRTVLAKITSIVDGGTFGLPIGLCVFGFEVHEINGKKVWF